MAKWSTLKAAIAQIIKTNNNQEITGQLLQNVLNNMVSSVGENSTFAGIATPSTNPGAPDGPIFYLAFESGTYPNFDGITISDDEVIILNYTTSWKKLQTGLVKKSKISEIESYLKPITAVIPITTGNALLYQLDVIIPKNTDFIVRLDDPNSTISGNSLTIIYSNNSSDPLSTNADKSFNKAFDISYIIIQRTAGGIIGSGNLTLSVDLSHVYNKKEIDEKLDQIQSSIKNIDTVPDAFGSAENLFDNSYFVSNIIQSSSYKGNSYNTGNAYSYENQGIKIPAASYHRFEFYTQTMGIKLEDTINIALHCSKVDDRFVFSGKLNNTSFRASKANYNVDGYWYIAAVKGTTERNELILNFDSGNAVGEVFIDRLFIWKGENIKAYGLNWKTTFQQLEKIKSTKFYTINYAPYYTSFGVAGSVSNERVEKNSLQFTANAGNAYSIEIPIAGTIFEDDKNYYISIVNNNIEDNIRARNLIVAYINSSNTEISRQTLPLSSLNRLSMLISTPENTVTIRIRVQVSQGTNIEVNVGELFITSFPLTNVEYYDIDRQPLLSDNSDNELSTIYVDSVSGSDDNDGTSLNYAVKTFTKALSVSKQNCTIILNGDISERLNMAGKQSVRLIGVQGQLNRIMTGTFIRSATSLGDNVYQTTLNTFPTLGVNIIFQHELADEATLIDTEQRHSLQRGKKYRCDSTPIIQAKSASEVSSNEFLSYYYDTSSKTLTFKIKSGTNLQTNPVVIPSGQANVYGNDGTVHFEMRNIESWYGNLDFRKCNGAIITDCASKYSLAGGGISYDFAVGITLVRCEVCRGRDGISAHSLGNRNTLAKCSVLTAIDCWSHDNYDDGYSDHENGEATIIGGLYEHNVKGGITPSYGAQDCYYNVTSQYNIEDGENPYHRGFFLSGAAETSEGGIGSQAILHNCISIGNDVNYECNSSGLANSKEANTMILYNCLSVDAKQYGYSAVSPSKIILYDCRDIGTSTPKNGDGITVKNSTLVDV